MKEFDKYIFFRIALLSFILNVSWTAMSTLANEFTEIDKGLITGLGYLLMLSFSFFSACRPLKY